jgi:excisionase family DNA binding protein
MAMKRLKSHRCASLSSQEDGPRADPSLPAWLPGRLMTASEAAGLLRVSVRHLRRLIAKGEVEPTRVGGAVRLSPEALAAFLRKK